MKPQLWIGGLLALFLFGCAVQPKFENPADFIGASYAAIEASANSVGHAYKTGRITQAQAQELAQRLVEAWNITVMAESLLADRKPQDAMETLRVAQRILVQLEQRLKEMEDGNSI